MEITVKTIRFVGGVNTYIGDMLDQMLALCKFVDEFGLFMKEYFDEHPDEIDNVYTVFMCSNPLFSIIIEREKISCIKFGEKFFNDQEQIFEAIVKKRLQSGEDEIFYRFSLRNKKDEKHN